MDLVETLVNTGVEGDFLIVLIFDTYIVRAYVRAPLRNIYINIYISFSLVTFFFLVVIGVVILHLYSYPKQFDCNLITIRA